MSKNYIDVKQIGTKWQYAYMDTALRFAELSTAVKLQVGAVAVKDNRIISIGYNGTPAGWDNVCEIETENGLLTRPEVIHAEANCLSKLASGVESSLGAEMYISHAPCLSCAKMMYSAGIKGVYYRHLYRCTEGIEFLHKCGISCVNL